MTEVQEISQSQRGWETAEDLNTWSHMKKKESCDCIFAYLIKAVCTHPLWHGRYQADNPFPSIPAAAFHDQFLRWQWWYGNMLRTLAFLQSLPQDLSKLQRLHHFCLRNQSWHAAVGMGRNELSTWRLPHHEEQTYRALNKVLRKQLGEFLFPSVYRMLHFFLPFKCTNFMKCVTELWIILYAGL